MILPNDITNLKTDITDKIGQKIIVKGTLGRSKFFENKYLQMLYKTNLSTSVSSAIISSLLISSLIRPYMM